MGPIPLAQQKAEDTESSRHLATDGWLLLIASVSSAMQSSVLDKEADDTMLLARLHKTLLMTLAYSVAKAAPTFSLRVDIASVNTSRALCPFVSLAQHPVHLVA